MADKIMHHVVIGGKTYEIVDEQGRENIAPPFSTSTTYTAGDYVIYGGKLYQFTAAHTGAWTGADAEETTVSEDISQLKEELYNTLVTDTASGSIASFPDGADNVPVKSLTVNIEPVQSGSGDPSPDNVRPISGHSTAVVTRTGKNLLPATVDGIKQSATSASWSGNIGTQSGVTFTLIQDEKGNLDSIVLNGTATATIQFFIAKGFSLTGNYILNGGKSESVSVAVGGKSSSTGGDKSYTDDGTSRNSWIYIANGTVCDNVVIKPMIRYASIADGTYEPYIADTYSITLPQTVYGGTLDVSTGELTVDRGACVFDGDENFVTSTSGMTFGTNLPNDVKLSTDASSLSGTICNQLKEVTQSSSWGVNATFSRIRQNTNIFFKLNDSITTIADLKTYLSSHPLQFVYPLETPQTLTLTPEQVTTLLGQNNIYADSGEVSVIYRADTGLYIDKRLNA